MTSTTVRGSRGAGADLGRRGIRLGDVAFRGIAVVAALAATVLLGLIAYKVIELAWPAIQDFGLSFIWTEAWDPVDERLRRADLHLRDGGDVGDRAPPRDADLDRDRALPHRDRARGASPRRSRRWSSSSPRSRASSSASGDPRLRPVGARPPRAVAPDRGSASSRSSRAPSTQAGMLPAALVLTIMIVPITSAICRELFIAHAARTSWTARSRSARRAGRRSAA